ncbi:cytochrome P450 [Kitasatospora sp. NPDC051853]|uniref:cytochrome P450 n=1 Tax=Kitasatospora sp. NPDC051853 TaxID=3364058 RepID=UPI00378E9744
MTTAPDTTPATAVAVVPTAPGRLPLLGHMLSLTRDPLGFVRSLAEVGELVRLELGTMPVYFVTTPELAHAVMVTHGSSFEKGRLFDRVRSMVGDGLATATTPVHRRHRRLIQPAFHRTQVAGYCEVIARQAEELAGSLRPGQEYELTRLLGEYSISTLAATMFSGELAAPAVAAVRRDVPVILKYMLVRSVSPKLFDRLPIPANRRFDRAAAGLRAVIDQVVAAARADGTTGTDLLSMLLAAQDADTGETLTDAEVRDELVTVLFAGTETVATTLGWALHEIARHPEVEQKLLAEIDEVLGGGPVTFEDLPRLGYARKVVDEVLRLHAVTMLMRRTVAPVELAGTVIPVGTEVAFSLYAVHQHPVHYPDPRRFDPDRDRPREAFFPFGAGARQCIGDAVARAELTVTLVALLRRWRFHPVAGQEPAEVMAAMPHADRIPMTVTPR